MNPHSNHRLTRNAQRLRRNMTKEERHLWYDFLKPLSVTFHRQKVIGHYIVDFYCADAQLAIELDGGQHYDPCGVAADAERDAALRRLGINVLRYANSDIWQNFSGVCEDIRQQLRAAQQSLPLEGKAARDPAAPARRRQRDPARRTLLSSNRRCDLCPNPIAAAIRRPKTI